MYNSLKICPCIIGHSLQCDILSVCIKTNEKLIMIIDLNLLMYEIRKIMTKAFDF